MECKINNYVKCNTCDLCITNATNSFKKKILNKLDKYNWYYVLFIKENKIKLLDNNNNILYSHL